MSYSTSIYALDLHLLQASVGSKDVELLRQIKLKYRDLLREADEWFGDEISQGAPTLEQAVAELIDGTLTAHGSATFQYGYALEVLCRHIGTRLKSDALGMIEGVGVAEQLATAGPPIAIPTWEDFPVIGYLTAQQVVGGLQRVEDQGLVSAEGHGTAGLIQLKACLKEAAARGVGLVAFLY